MVFVEVRSGMGVRAMVVCVMWWDVDRCAGSVLSRGWIVVNVDVWW